MKKLLKFIPIQLTLFLIFGILVGYYCKVTILVALTGYLVSILLLGVIYLLTKTYQNLVFLFTIFSWITTFLIGVGTITLQNQLNTNVHYANNTHFVEGEPVKSILVIDKVLKPNAYYFKYEGEVEALFYSKTKGKVLLNVEREIDCKILNVGDRIMVKSAFQKINKPLNPNFFNYRSFLEKQQIYHQLHISNNQFVHIFKEINIKSLAADFRNKVNKALQKNGFKDDELAVINALLLGQRTQITPELTEDYVRAGAIHILAVSGLHIGILLLFLTVIFKPLHYLKHGKFWASAAIICCLWMYAVIAGLSPSVVRAVTMFTAVTIGVYLNKPSNINNTLFISMFILLLLLYPYYVFDVGFQLSYIAVFSIVWIQPKLNQLLTVKYWFLNKIWQLFTVSVAAQLGVLPLSLFYFHQFPGLFFISNLVIIPFLGIVLILGILIIGLSLGNFLPLFFAEIYMNIIKSMNVFVAWISNKEQFVIQHINISFLGMLALYGFLILMVSWLYKKNYFKTKTLLISIIFIQFIFLYEKYNVERNKEFIVFNKTGNSLLAIKRNHSLTYFSSEKSLQKFDKIIENYTLGRNSKEQYFKNNRFLFFNEDVILRIDSLGYYNVHSVKPTIIVLQNNPKINLERLLKKFQPKIIIADASNFKSYAKMWEETCIKNKTPFYDTSKKGAFILKRQ